MSETDYSSSLNKFQKFFFSYGIYHFDTINVSIHLICIPILTFTLIRMLDYFSMQYLKIGIPLGLIFISLVSVLYLYVDPFSGFITSGIYFSLELLLMNNQSPIFGYGQIDFIIYVHILSWIAQFIGHGLFEGRKPALMDNIFLTLNAPVFVTLEILEKFNYRREELIEARECMRKEVEKFRSLKKVKK